MKKFEGLKVFFLLWSTQALSSLGSSMTSYALIIWAYQQSGSALTTGLLTISSYAPYVLFGFFAGALSDQWNKKNIMLITDLLAAVSTCIALVLLLTNNLEIWHIYPINLCNGLLSAFQQPASEVAITTITPKEKYQETSGLRSFSHSLVSVLTPVFATILLTFTGLEAVIIFDLASFLFAFLILLFWIDIPHKKFENKNISFFDSIKEGFSFLKVNRGILDLILFLAGINFIASMCDNALPALILSKSIGGKEALGAVNTFSGLASLVGSILVSMLPAPKSRISVICTTLLLSMSIENFFLAFFENVPLWCIATFTSWIVIPFMGANTEVILRTTIPIELQGRVFATRNTLQFFTIPLGYLFSGIFIDHVFEPLMAAERSDSLLVHLFGEGKGSGSALLIGIIWVLGILICLAFSKNKHLWALEETEKEVSIE